MDSTSRVDQNIEENETIMETGIYNVEVEGGDDVQIRVDQNIEENETIMGTGIYNVEVEGGDDVQIVNQEAEDNRGDIENDGEVKDGQSKLGGRKRQKTSIVHGDFIEVAGDKGLVKFQCIHCKAKFTKNASRTTSHLKNHLERCLQKSLHTKTQRKLQLQPEKSKFEMPLLSNGRYDHSKQREAIAHWVLMNEQPFKCVENPGFSFMFKLHLPEFEKISRAMIRNDVQAVYDMEKKKLCSMLRGISKISLTTDIWKSKVQKTSYMCVTGHFVDSQWHLQKRVLSFIPLPLPHGGVDIFDGLMKCTKDWGIEHKIFTISVDNASNNDVALRIAKDTFSKSRSLPLDGKMFHVRCSAHILNLVVQDGLSDIKCIIEDVKDSVRFINQSEGRLIKFSEIVHHLDIPVKKLIIDCPTRWNSTYEMLVEAIKVKDAFPIFAQREPLYKYCPSPEDWDKVDDVVAILEVFYEATQVMSRTDYPTSNVFLAIIWRVKHILDEKENHPNEFIRHMARKMKSKFDKYWGNCNLLMAIGAILDPRFKMRLVEFAFNKIYNENDVGTNLMKVREALYNLFFEYVAQERTRTSSFFMSGKASSRSTTTTTSKGKLIPSGLSMYDDYLNSVEEHEPTKSELDIYLEEGVYRCQDGEAASEFDALNWWKSQELKFGILSKLARDVLAIPISTVASEATFSAETRVLDPYRANLSSDIVEVLICGADWVRQLHGIKKPLMTYEEEVPVDVQLKD